MKIPSFLKSTTTLPPPHHSPEQGLGRQWRKWPSCNYPDTLSFRCPSTSVSAFDGIFKTLNSIYFDSAENDDAGFLPTETEHPAVADFTVDAISFSTDSDSEDDSEMVVRGIRSSDRLFFDPDQINSAILLRKTEELEEEEEEKLQKKPSPPPLTKGFPFEESVVLAMESEDPYLDFRRSMEEMVEFQGIDCKDWDRLEELLQWYLNVNGKKNHGFIVGAFLDLLVGISGADGGCGCGPTAAARACDSSASTTTSFSTAVTCLSPSHSSSTTNSDSSSSLFYRHQVKFY
ncbi:Transcription repressor OFP13 [Linum perenne]